MKKKFNQLLDSKKFTGYIILVLFSTVALINAMILGTNYKKQTNLTNSLERMESTDNCPEGKDCTSGPAHSKYRVSNNDGTYKISLDVKGEASTEVENPNVNVIVVYDASSSMTSYRTEVQENNRGRFGQITVDGKTTVVPLFTRSGNNNNYTYTKITNDTTSGTVYYKNSDGTYSQYTGTRYAKTTGPRRADAAEKVIFDFTNSLFSYQNHPDGSNIEMALITFNSDATNRTSSWTNPSSGWTSNASVITDHLSNSGEYNSSKLDDLNPSAYAQGTNYEAALRSALTLLGTADGDPTFVIFVTDGEPSKYGVPSNSGWIGAASCYGPSQDEARAIQIYDTKTHTSNEETSNTTLFGIYAYGDEYDYLDDVIYYALNGSKRANETTDTVPTDNYFNASDTSALTAAINTIFNKIVDVLGINTVSISDGTTSNVKTTSGKIAHLLEVDTTSYEYWLTMPAINNKITRIDLVTGDPYEIELSYDSTKKEVTATSDKWSKPVVVEGELNSGLLKYKWTKATALYDYAPPEASFANDAVDWDLSSLGTLLDQVTYTVTFDVYPSQDTYDLVANFKNGTISYTAHYSQSEYNALPESLQKYYSPVKNESGEVLYYELDSNIRKYLSEDFKLETNTEAILTYSDSRTDEDEEPIKDVEVYYNELDGTPLASSQIEVEKIWSNALDSRNATEPVLDEDGNPVYNEDGTPKTKPLVLDMYLIKDGEKTSEKITVTYKETCDEENNCEENSELSWKDLKYISTGLLRTKTIVKDDDGNIIGGTIQVLDKGHDYTLEEPASISYHWELNMETVHPMLISNSTKVTTLVEVTGSDIPEIVKNADENTFNVVDGKTYYKFTYNGKVRVYVVKSTEDTAKLKAYNNRKSYVEFKKVVTGDAPAGKEFDFTFQVKNVIGENEKDDSVWFSVWDSKTNSQVIDLNGLSATLNGTSVEVKAEKNDDGKKTGAYSVPNNSIVTVKLQDGWNLRILNLGTTSTYSVSEENVTICAEETCTKDELEASNPKYFDLKDISISATSGTDAQGKPVAIEYNECEGNTENDYCIKNNTITGKVIKPDTAYSITYKNEYPGTYVTAEKNWLVEDIATIQDKSIEVQLLQRIKGENDKTPVLDEEGKTVTATLNKNNNWNYTFEGLPLVTQEEEPREIEYFVEESGVQGYTTSIIQGKADETGKVDKHIWVITNIEQTEILVTKEWDDANNQDRKRPTNDLAFTLKDGKGNVINKTPTKVTDDEDNKDYYKYTELDKYDSEGNLINYTVTETVPSGYTVSAIKIVDGKEETVTGADAVANAANSFTLTNTYVPEVIDITVNKEWADGYDQDGIRPDDVEVTLYQSIDGATPTPVKDKDGKNVTATLTANADDATKNWQTVFNNLPRYKDGKEITYSVRETTTNVLKGTAEEDDAPGTYKINNGGTVVSADGSITVTNTHTPEKTSITATKIWDDKSDQDGVRPDAIQFQLYAGTEPATNTAIEGEDKNIYCTLSNGDTPSDTWTCAFNNLPKYKDGELIEYSVREINDLTNIEGRDYGYDAPKYKVVDDKEDKLTIINKRIPETIDIPVEKVWDDKLTDETSETSNRVAINVQLYKPGVNEEGQSIEEAVSGKSATLNESNEWKTTFTGLDKYSNGTEIQYTVKETSTVTGYDAPRYTVDEETGALVVTNTLSKTKVTVTKNWNDEQDKYNNRPKYIDVALNYGGLTARLDEENDWTYTFDNLPVYVSGNVYVYSADEVSVPTGYVKGKPTIATNNGVKTITINNNTETTTVDGTKTWADQSDEGNQPTSVTIKLKIGENYVKDDDGNDLTAIASAENGWKYSFTGLPKYIDTKEVTYTVEEVVPAEYTVSYDGNNTINTLNRVKITGVKKWADEYQYGNQPDSITVNLKRNGIQVDYRTVRASDNWAFTFDNLPEYIGHEKASYSIEEVTPAGYTSSAVQKSSTTANGVTTITYEVENTLKTTELSGEKIWDDGFDQSNRPDSITVNLMTVDADGNKTPAKDKDGKAITKEVEVDKTTGRWTYEFTDLPTYVGKKAVTYAVEEVVPTGYESIVVGNNITNKLVTVEVDVNKLWPEKNQEGNQPDSITVKLMTVDADGNKTPAKDANGNEITGELNPDNNWSYEFKNLPKYKDKNTTPVKYTVEEINVPGYESTLSDPVVSTDGKITSYTITNKLKRTSITVEKFWDDNNNQDGIREKSIVVTLNYGDLTATLNADNEWTHTFEDLPLYIDKEEYQYEVSEVQVKGYDKPVITGSGTVEDPFVITNTHKPEVINVTVNKDWNDGFNQDNIRPTSVEVTLYQQIGNGTATPVKDKDGKNVTATLTANADDEDKNWKAVFENLPKKSAGQDITYSVVETTTNVLKGTAKEDDAPGTYRINNGGTVTSNDGSITVTNTHTPVTTKITFNKAWEDASDQDGKRKDLEAVVQVRKIGETKPVLGPITIAIDKDNWSYTFEGLDVYEHGEPIEYVVEEVYGDAQVGYSSNYPNGYTITAEENDSGVVNFVNTYNPESINIGVVKDWQDNDDQDGIRPTSIEVTLYQSIDGATPTPVKDKDGKNVTATLTANADDATKNWQTVFNNLPRYKDGKEITYSVRETTTNVLKGTAEEDDAPGTYKINNGGTVVSADGSITVTNTHTPELIDIEATKIWKDNNNQDGKRPTAVQFQLYADDKPAKNDKDENIYCTLTGDLKAESWTCTFNDLPKYNHSKTPINYTVIETTDLTSEGYSTEANGLTVTNTRTTEEIEISITKNWDDNNDQDGIRPTSIDVDMTSQIDGEEEPTFERTITLTNSKLTETITKLPKYRNGKLITYTFTETRTTVVNGTNGPGTYAIEDNKTVKGVDGTTKYSVEIKNTHTPETIRIEGTKYWDDNNNQDGLRDDDTTISVTLTGSDGSTRNKTVSKGTKGDWAFAFEDLPKYNKTTTPIVYTLTETQVEDYDKPVVVKQSENNNVIIYLITNKHTPETTSITATKKWSDNSNQDGLRDTNTKVKFELFADGVSTGKTIELSGNPEKNSYSDTFTNLPVYNNGTKIEYTVREVIVPTGYEAKAEGNENKEGTKDNNYTITNEHETETISIDVTKDWQDNNNQDGLRNDDTTVTFQLYADGTKVEGKTVTLTKGNDWTATFTDLDKKANGKDITYTVKETTTFDGYTPSAIGNDKAEGTAANDYTITNTHKPELTNITVKKEWEDNKDQDGLRKDAKYEITLIGTRDDNVNVTVKNATVELSSSVTTYTYYDLPVYDAGHKITYTAKETKVPDGYKDSYSEDGLTITNTHKPVETEVEVTKIWDDEDNRDGIRPENITLILTASTKTGGSYTVDAKQPTPVKKGNTWTYTYTGLPKNKNGEEITYTVSEKDVENYKGTPDGLTITNYHEPEKIKIPVTKQWVDADDQDGKRPKEITVELYADGEYKDSIVLKPTENASIKDPWKGEFTGLPKYKAGEEGKEIEYTIKEVSDVLIAKEGEKPLYNGTINGFDIVNEHVPSKKTISGEKVWDDDNNRDGIRPDSITINLLVNGTVKDSRTLPNEDGSWTYSFENLPEYENGKVIPYQVDEEGVTIADDAYSKTVDNGTYTITNKHTPSEISIKGTKEWSDGENQDGIRPEKITVNLMTVDAEGNKTPAKDKDGKAITKEVTADADGKWSFEFTGLPEYEHGKVGKKITYAVTEESVEGYTADIPEGSYIITNKHTPATVTYIVSKDWDDEDNNDGIRPSSITVKLLADGKVKETVKLSNANKWTHTFGPLDKNKAGKEIEYTIEEEPVPGYKLIKSEPIVENETITRVLTNKHVPEKVSINGKKTWIDENNKNGKRPKTITVYVYANGIKVAELTVSEDSNWEYELKELYKFNHSTTPIEYTIEEKPIEGYDTEYDGYNIINIETEVEGEKEELPPDTYAKDQMTYKIDFLITLLGGMILTVYKRVIKE